MGEKVNMWGSLSSHAYGADAVFIPEYGKPEGIEFILVLTQGYPCFKTHPALDIWQGYTRGRERFDSNRNMRVLAWNSDPDKNYWSFLYLPDNDDACRITAEFVTAENGRLDLRLRMENYSEDAREWQWDIYAAPIHTDDLPGLELKENAGSDLLFSLCGLNWKITSPEMRFKNMKVVDSGFWVNFPANVDAETPLEAAKQRLKIVSEPVTVFAGESRIVSVALNCVSNNKSIPRSFWPEIEMASGQELPYAHQWWEILHNRHYVRSFNSDAMTCRFFPAHQWGRFYIWDAGMTILGALEESILLAEEQLAEMPDPAVMKEDVFSDVGSFIPTCILAWWELYCLTGDKETLSRHYDHMKRLFLAFYAWPDLVPSPDHNGLVKTRDYRNGIDDHPARVYCGERIFAWDYKQTLPVNPDRRFRQAHQPGLTSLAVRYAGILRLAAYVLGKDQDMDYMKALIEKSERSLNEDLWSEEHGIYVWRTEEDGRLPMYGLDGCYPMLSNSVPPERLKRITDHVFNPEGMWTKYGLTVVPQNSPYYRDKGYWNGAVWVPPQWFMWKAFYNHGYMDKAEIIADRLLDLWEKNHAEDLCCWEKFDIGSDGRGAGNSRFSGLSAPVISLARARRRPGRVQFGHDVLARYEVGDNQNSFAGVFHSPFDNRETGISVVLQPLTDYRLCREGSEDVRLRSDQWGYLGFTVNLIAGESVKVSVKP
ncbi:MAG: trehalase family glycosidase [bacterium]|nr:trehalase family glycosidase [bacterium]